MSVYFAGPMFLCIKRARKKYRLNKQRDVQWMIQDSEPQLQSYSNKTHLRVRQVTNDSHGENNPAFSDHSDPFCDGTTPDTSCSTMNNPNMEGQVNCHMDSDTGTRL